MLSWNLSWCSFVLVLSIWLLVKWEPLSSLQLLSLSLLIINHFCKYPVLWIISFREIFLTRFTEHKSNGNVSNLSNSRKSKIPSWSYWSTCYEDTPKEMTAYWIIFGPFYTIITSGSDLWKDNLVMTCKTNKFNILLSKLFGLLF